MRKFKKLLAIVIALAMLLTGMSVVSFADTKDSDLNSFLSEYYSAKYQGYLSMVYADIEKFYDASIPQNVYNINDYKNMIMQHYSM